MPKKRRETFVCRKDENTEFMRCICGLCKSAELQERLEEINLMVCYAMEENTDADRGEMLNAIGQLARGGKMPIRTRSE